MHVAFPFRFDQHGRTAQATDDEYLRDLIIQLLLTRPGERVNRPTFGVGIVEHVFGPNGPQVSAAVRAQLQAALQQELGPVLEVQDLEVTSNDSLLEVSLVYRRPPAVAPLAVSLVVPTGSLV